MARPLVALLAVLAASLIALPAEAQWKWRDKGGHVQYSDLPPPPGTPDGDILARPSATMRRAAVTSVAPRGSAASAASAARRARRPRRRAPPIPSSKPSARRPRPTAAAKAKAEQERIAAAEGRQLQPRPRPADDARERHPPGADQRQDRRARVPRRQAARRRDAPHPGRDRERLQVGRAQRRAAARRFFARRRRASFGSIVSGR